MGDYAFIFPQAVESCHFQLSASSQYWMILSKVTSNISWFEGNVISSSVNQLIDSKKKKKKKKASSLKD